MQGSDLGEILEAIYARNTIPHMLSGKAVSRAIRGHLVVDSALNTMLIARAYAISQSLFEENLQSEDDDAIDRSTPLPMELKLQKICCAN